jgi:hypothetical protein
MITKDEGVRQSGSQGVLTRDSQTPRLPDSQTGLIFCFIVTLCDILFGVVCLSLALLLKCMIPRGIA